ncbi:MAG TPA: response regulator [Bacteroidota bacterium]|nr:response regulator [Bacteroidota bacterium]
MNPRVLVVDDEDTLRLTLKARLQSNGFDVSSASNGEEALEIMKTHAFDIALLDVNMPQLNGLQVLEVIRDQHPHTDVIMLTGFADFSTAIECLKMGAKDYLVKPIEPTELLTRLQALIRARSSERALFEYQQRQMSTIIYNILGPLNMLHSSLQHIAMVLEKGKSDVAQQLLGHAQELNEKMAQHLKDLIDVSNLNLTGVDLSRSRADLKALVEKVYARFEWRSNGKNLKLTKNLPAKLPNVEVDSEKVEQVLDSIMNHAVSTASSESTVAVSVTKAKTESGDGEEIVISVTTDKSSMDANEILMLFNQSVEDSLAGPALGPASLGLAIARKILEAHGGSLSIDSTVGKRTEYRIRLPIH